MARRCSLVTAITLVLATVVVSSLPYPLQAQSGPSVAFVREIDMPTATMTKYPQLAVDRLFASRDVHVSVVDGSSRSTSGVAKVWSKNEEAGAFPAPLLLGTVGAGTAPDYVQSAIATAPTGEVYVAWVDQATKTIKLRRREPSGAWEATTFDAVRGHEFAVEPALVVRSNGQLILAWRDYGVMKYVFSNDRGATWSSVGAITSVPAYKSQTSLAAGPNGEVALAFTRNSPLHVVVALWNGTAFNPPVDVNGSHPSAFADGSVSFSPQPGAETRIAVAYRIIGDGVFVTERLVSAFNQPWNVPAPIIDGTADGRVSVDYDEAGNLHVVWIRQGSSGRSSNQLYYTARPAGQTAFLPVASAPTIAPIFNAWGDARAGSRVNMHAIHEIFQGASVTPRYVQFQANIVVFGSRPVIEGDAAIVGGEGKVSVNVTFPEITAAALPDQVRWRWGAPPTDTENDSGGWQPFNPTGPTSVLTVPIPDSLRTDVGCVERELFTQLRRSVNNLTDQPRSDKVVIDGSVLGSAVLVNPFSRYKTSPFTAVTPADLIGEGGASDGHPDYTRALAVFVELRSLGDCSGLQRFALAPSMATLASVSNMAISGNRFANVLPYPGVVAEGPMPVVLRMRDALGNPMVVERTLTYDVTPPVLNSGDVQVQAISGAPTIVVQLQFNSLSVTDNLYPGRGFWGVWLANSRSPVANPASDPGLVWTPVEAPGSGTSFSLIWSLASGLPDAQVTAGTYYVYARVLDGAGNPSATALPVATITIDQVTLPTVFVPLLVR
ncbi:exo-alpha-sialidase [Chloroflexus sp.]|uniref:exo-alpha-sialidase n=1 Tax=Chloroflexus sp. TaxID=1904827 RepID=UPI00298F3D23|nr:exo-alpha-sialidase [Chloroflexus sp.]MDW8402686.1 exo-alpha-sialidase [Chloroflexus sp.]